MFVRNLRAPGANARAWAIFTSAIVGLLAAPAGAATAPAVPVGVTMDQYDLSPQEGPGAGMTAAELSRLTPAADAAPIIGPLPPPLVSGFIGLGTLAALRVGRRVYRRR